MSPIPELISLNGVLFLIGHNLPVIEFEYIFLKSEGWQYLASYNKPIINLPLCVEICFLSNHSHHRNNFY